MVECLKAERWVMRHGVATGGLRLQEKLNRGRQVPVAMAPLLPIRGDEEIPKIALRAWDAKAVHGDRGPCVMEPPWLAGGPWAGSSLQPTILHRCLGGTRAVAIARGCGLAGHGIVFQLGRGSPCTPVPPGLRCMGGSWTLWRQLW